MMTRTNPANGSRVRPSGKPHLPTRFISSARFGSRRIRIRRARTNSASVKARADAPNKEDIPWLLLTARNTGTPGSFSTVTSIQRVNTVGGSAPASGCNAATVGQEARVHYTADYRFFTQR